MGAEGYYDDSDSMEDKDDADIRMKAELIRDKKALMMNEARMRKSLKNRAVIPRAKKARTVTQMEKHFNTIGLDATAPAQRARAQMRDSRLQSSKAELMELDTPAARARSISRAPKTNRLTDGLATTRAGIADPAKRDKTERLAKVGQRKMNRMARQGEADRHTTAALPKHLFSGKRGIGSTRSR